jgi:UDP-N-acetyl-D-mannosaminuronic acid dehydrogenase
MVNKFHHSISIVGGAGHVGLPLALSLCKKNFNILLIDINTKNLEKISKGVMPFIEYGAPHLLKKYIKKKKIKISNQLSDVYLSKYIIICIGTPIDKKLKPKEESFLNLFLKLNKFIRKDQIIIIRSSTNPGVCNKIFKILKNKNISYCPERIVQGQSLKEMPRLPQIISGFTKLSIKESKKIFNRICKKVIVTSVLEAELIKLFSNAYRYILFSITNDFFRICNNLDINYIKLRKNMIEGYERNQGLPPAGFTSGPCLLKDTMQLSSFLKNNFSLGDAAMDVNENLPINMLNKLSEKINIKNKVVGVLGVTFKADIDDIRDSLGIKLINYLKKKKFNYYYTDPYYKDDKKISIKKLIKKSDIIIVSTPHTIYKKIKIPNNKIILDIWGIINTKL